MRRTNLDRQIETIKRRIEKLPKLLNSKLMAVRKKDAELFIKYYQQGLKNDSLGLKRLNPVTIKRKKELGYEKPYNPLYGAGESEENSLINIFKIKKLKNGWEVYPRWAKHHNSDLQLRQLLAIHENGALIQVTEKMRAFLHYIGIHLSPNTSIIRIPPRPARQKAYQKLMNELKRKEDYKEVRQYIRDYIFKGKI